MGRRLFDVPKPLPQWRVGDHHNRLARRQQAAINLRRRCDFALAGAIAGKPNRRGTLS